jgi:hypothetical protein
MAVFLFNVGIIITVVYFVIRPLALNLNSANFLHLFIKNIAPRNDNDEECLLLYGKRGFNSGFSVRVFR